jgi:hypothetical protein
MPGLEDFRSSGPASHFIWCSHHAQKGERGMAHVISARLARLAGRINARLAIPFLYAVWHGWQARHVRPGTWNFRDPRFDTFALGGQPHYGKSEASMLLAARVQRALDDGKAVTIIDAKTPMGRSS